ncbi:MAG: class II aldolase/adducin family protein [bacterium]|nr:class II aldolase/adducin family protein [bacterium]
MLLQTGHRLDERGFIAANDGNLSARWQTGRFLVTRSGSMKGRLEPFDLLVVDESGMQVAEPQHPGVPAEYRVSSEWKMHLALYRARPDIHAVVHAHPPFATAWAASRKELPEPVLPEVTVILREVPLVPFAVPGTQEFADTVAKVAREKNTTVLLLANHGVVAVGADPIAALDQLERVEHAAKILLLSKIIDGPVKLTESEAAALAAAYPR